MRRALGTLPGLAMVLLATLPVGCSDDKDAPKEVVAPVTERTPYAEDPDLAQSDKKEAAQKTAPDNPAPNESAAVGELTNDHAPVPPSTPPEVTPEASAEVGPTDDGDAVGGALAQNTPNYKPAPGILPPEEAAPHHGKGQGKDAGKHAAKGKKGQHGRTGTGADVRYVSAQLLNVRAAPSLQAKRVRQLTGGSQVNVEMHGKWAKIKEGEWIRTKYLSETPVQ